MTDVLKLTSKEAEPAEKPARKKDESAEIPRRARSSIGHPEGERAGKRESALAANLKKWLTGRKSKS